MAVFDLGSLGWGSLFGWLAGRGGRGNLSDPPVSGQRREIGIDGAMQIATVWACIRLLSETVGTLSCGVYSKDSAGRRSGYAGKLYELLHEEPNADMAAEEFWEACVAYLCTVGNFYAEKVVVGGELKALNVITGGVKVYRENGARRYAFRQDGELRDLSEEEVFHVRGFGFGRDVGLSPIGFARQALWSAQDANDASASAITKGVAGAGFLVIPGKSTPEQRKGLLETFVDPITGPNPSRRVGVLEQGLDWKPIIGLPPEDLQILETRGFHVEELCRWFGVPPFMIGHMQKSTAWGTGLEQQNLGFLTYSLRPYLKRIEGAVRKQLRSPAEKKAGVYAEFNVESLLRADSAGRAALYASAAQNGWMTRNEIRALESLSPVDGGDVLTVQVNLTPLGQLGLEPSTDGLKLLRLALLGPAADAPLETAA